MRGNEETLKLNDYGKIVKARLDYEKKYLASQSQIFKDEDGTEHKIAPIMPDYSHGLTMYQKDYIERSKVFFAGYKEAMEAANTPVRDRDDIIKDCIDAIAAKIKAQNLANVVQHEAAKA